MLSQLVERLSTHAVGLTSVDMAEDLDALARGTAAGNGACFVVPYRERARPNAIAAGGHRQQIDVQIIVAFVVVQASDPRGAARAAAFDAFKAAIEGALAGWAPGDEFGGLSLVGGEATPLGNGVTVYAQTWETTRLLTGG